MPLAQRIRETSPHDLPQHQVRAQEDGGYEATSHLNLPHLCTAAEYMQDRAGGPRTRSAAPTVSASNAGPYKGTRSSLLNCGLSESAGNCKKYWRVTSGEESLEKML